MQTVLTIILTKFLVSAIHIFTRPWGPHTLTTDHVKLSPYCSLMQTQRTTYGPILLS
ncbi:protein of unknown function [Kyrpidia spormannii]|uniref:Uncharacterized protein n=2 Tax=Kyrpidia spormannii TaxID=2055160 RepID=A0ACA8Z551_9BACL|nr:protein of unknown function [Kyrpidia spormannii]CAB3390194.1 protein of unknown function [Kyrpidia spormannii]